MMEEKIVVLSDVLKNRPVSELTTAVSGKDLALNPTQISSLSGNYQAKASSFQPVESVSVEPSVTENIPNFDPIVNEVENITEIPQEEIVSVNDSEPSVESPIIENVSVVPETPVIEEPFVSVVPDLDPVLESNEMPSIESAVIPPVVGQVEIVSETPVSSDYDVLVEKIQEVNTEFDSKVIELNQQRNAKILSLIEESKKKIVETERNIIDLKNRAEEHLKNAQAAEQIATIAHQNAQNIQGVQDMQDNIILEKAA